MDKPKNQDPLNEKIQEIMKAVCYKLYNPNEIMNGYVQIQEPKTEFLEWAEKAINENWIQYLPENITDTKEIVSVDNSNTCDDSDFEFKLDKINKLNNQEFIFSLLNLSVEYGIFEDLYPVLINADLCKEYFLQSYAVLVPSKNEVDKARYYSNLFEYEGKSYYVTNDWYGEESKNARKNRIPFISMIREMLREA